MTVRALAERRPPERSGVEKKLRQELESHVWHEVWRQPERPVGAHGPKAVHNRKEDPVVKGTQQLVGRSARTPAYQFFPTN